MKISHLPGDKGIRGVRKPLELCSMESGSCSFLKLKMGSFHFCFFIYRCDERQFGRFPTTWLLLALKNILVDWFLYREKLSRWHYNFCFFFLLNALFLLHSTYYALYNNLCISIKIYQTSDFMKNIDLGDSFENCYKTFILVWFGIKLDHY